MEAKKILIEPVKKDAGKAEKLRVAAYCRVSTDTDDQQTSFEGQIKHYTELIEANPEWEFAGIYADDGITGTSAEKRPEFMRMIKDCEEGRISLVICKSISRFARNTLDCITIVRHLNSIGVHIIFEINKIDTRATYSEMLLTVLAAFAQEESRSISENTSWGIRKRFEEGVTRWTKLYGYEKTEAGEYQIVPDQAAAVKKIFDLYEHGDSLQSIRDYLAAHDIKSPKGEARWTNSAVHTLLLNERYTGDILLQKYYTEDHLSHKHVKNMVECQKYVKILKGNGVDVRFEKENLDTADPSCTMMFSFLAAIAQDESRSISENVKWAYRERFKRGEYNLGNNRILGYDSVDGKLVPNEDAGIVAVIFQMYFEGKTLADITSTMDAMGIMGLKGKPMTVSGIRYILGNESYVGDKLLQKQAPRDFLTKKPDKNACYESKYLVDDHEAVVSREVWDAVQLRLGQHQEEVMSGGYYDGRSHFLHGRVFCGDCGTMMTRRTVRCSSRPDNKETHKVWTCKERHKGRKGNGCLMRNIPEEELLAAICFQMGLPNVENFPVGRFRREIERVEVMDNGVWVVPRRMVKTA